MRSILAGLILLVSGSAGAQQDATHFADIVKRMDAECGLQPTPNGSHESVAATLAYLVCYRKYEKEWWSVGQPIEGHTLIPCWPGSSNCSVISSAGAQTDNWPSMCPAPKDGEAREIAVMRCLYSISGGAATTNIGTPVPPWRLITQTYGGRIDIRKGLTEAQCEHDRLKSLNQPADSEEKTYAAYFAEKDSSMSVDQYAYTRISTDIRHAVCEKQP